MFRTKDEVALRHFACIQNIVESISAEILPKVTDQQRFVNTTEGILAQCISRTTLG